MAREAGLETDDTDEKIRVTKKALIQEKKVLKRKQDDAERQQKSRDSKKQKMAELLEEHPELAEKLKFRDRIGKPKVEDNQPDLFKVWHKRLCIHNFISNCKNLKLRNLKKINNLLIHNYLHKICRLLCFNCLFNLLFYFIIIYSTGFAKFVGFIVRQTKQ